MYRQLTANFQNNDQRETILIFNWVNVRKKMQRKYNQLSEWLIIIK